MKNKQMIFAKFNNKNILNKGKTLNNKVINFLENERIINKDRYTKDDDDLMAYTINLLKQLNSKI